MSVCDICAHCDKLQGRKCTFSGNCVVNTYNLRGNGTLEAFINPKTEEFYTEEAVAADDVVIDSNFNPFQRGNGCMLADLIKTR